MFASEFQLIERYFQRSNYNDDVLLGIGDDTAIVHLPEKKSLFVCTDTLIKNVHFPEQTSAIDIGYKSLAVNLSDMAAMGANPAWATLAITVPEADELWLQEFVRGFNQLAKTYRVELVGGDTTRGQLSITVQLMGYGDANTALRRSGAIINDDIWLSGTIGDAALGLLHIKEKNNPWLSHLNRPNPRIVLGQKLIGIAHSCIDVSDGLLADLNHLLHASNCGAIVQIQALPMSSITAIWLQKHKDIYSLLNGGDDYELLFTANKNQRQKILSIADAVPLTRIGKIVNPQDGLKLYTVNGQVTNAKCQGYDHFI